jgi:hypothetical protein
VLRGLHRVDKDKYIGIRSVQLHRTPSTEPANPSSVHNRPTYRLKRRQKVETGCGGIYSPGARSRKCSGEKGGAV